MINCETELIRCITSTGPLSCFERAHGVSCTIHFSVALCQIKSISNCKGLTSDSQPLQPHPPPSSSAIRRRKTLLSVPRFPSDSNFFRQESTASKFSLRLFAPFNRRLLRNKRRFPHLTPL